MTNYVLKLVNDRIMIISFLRKIPHLYRRTEIGFTIVCALLGFFSHILRMEYGDKQRMMVHVVVFGEAWLFTVIFLTSGIQALRLGCHYSSFAEKCAILPGSLLACLLVSAWLLVSCQTVLLCSLHRHCISRVFSEFGLAFGLS